MADMHGVISGLHNFHPNHVQEQSWEKVSYKRRCCAGMSGIMRSDTVQIVHHSPLHETYQRMCNVYNQ